MAPIKDPQGTRHFQATEKCELLANFFEKRLGDGRKGMVEDTCGFSKTAKKNLCRQGYRGKMQGKWDPFTAVEVKKAIMGLSKKKATGEDGIGAEVLENLPCLTRPLARLFNMVLPQGKMPYPLLKVIMFPLAKPKKDREECKSKRPISLIQVIAKTLEAAVLHRLPVNLEDKLSPQQYAYRRERGAEMHLADFSDFVKELRDEGCDVYIASIDSAPHSRLMETLHEWSVDMYLCRYVHPSSKYT